MRIRLLPLAAACVFTAGLNAAAIAAPNEPHTVQSSTAPAGPATTKACPAILNKTFNRLQDDAPQALCQYAGKVILVVNTASYCGFTSQYEALEKLYAEQAPRGLVILGFPSNDFGAQEPGSNKEIADFCFNTYGVKFPMFAKSSVKGPQANVLFSELAALTHTPPRWNFYKYLIDRNGKVVDSYSSLTAPYDSRLQTALQRALAQP
jgi:glutathione peroxidase